MRTTFFSSLLFALLTSTSVAVIAAPVDKPPMAAPMTGGSMPSGAMNAAALDDSTGKVNLNSADAVTLQKELTGIGKNKAEAIVAYRETNGQFTSIDELIEVKGIGKAILDKNREKLSLE